MKKATLTGYATHATCFFNDMEGGGIKSLQIDLP